MRVALAGCVLLIAACAPASPPADGAAPPAGAEPMAEPAAEAAVAPATGNAGSSAPHGGARLSGRVGYPSEELPAMRVCAIAVEDPGLGYCTMTAKNAPHYDLAVPAGSWWLLAWPQDTGTAGDPGLLSAASECLGSGGTGCDDHALFVLTVAAGEHREGLDINDWYYDPATEPPPMEPRGETPLQ